MSSALWGSGIGFSGISGDGEPSAVETDEQKNSAAGVGWWTDSENCMRLWRPLMCGLKVDSGRLKLTGHAEWIMRETDCCIL